MRKYLLLDGVLGVMDQFARMLGMHINVAKSSLYAVDQNKHLMQQFADSRGFSIGSLPFRYLGLPLTSRKGVD
ncbi:hypothetical protein Bca101_026667 [Brassica carinata]